MSMTEEQAKQFLAVQKMILERVSVAEIILICFAVLAGLCIIVFVILAITM